MQDSMFIGLDVHKATISVAVAQGGRGGEVRHWGSVRHRPDHVRKLAEKRAAGGARLHFCYEAGPCGYGLYRQLVEMDHECIVVAPSLIPVKAGDRVKTDRRDAVMLAKLHRAGELTAVWVPDAAHEAMRDLVRARATAMRVAGKARQHLQGFLLRHGRIYPGKKGWTGAYRRWLAMVRFTHPAQQIVLQDYIDAVADAEARVERLTGQIADLLPNWSLAPVVEAVQAMRGVGFIVAVTVVAEVGDFHRFDTPRQLMAYLGLTPSEHSSGASVRRGGITKAGSGLARRALIEGAWSYRMQARVSPKLHARLEALPKAVRAIAWKGQLATTLWSLVLSVFLLRLMGQGMMGHAAMVAMARWFVATRGRAIAIAGLGVALGEATLPLLFVLLKSEVGWRSLWLVATGCLVLFAILLFPLLRRERTPQSFTVDDGAVGMLGRNWTRTEVLRDRLFWLTLPAIIGPAAWNTAFFFHQVHFAATKGWAHLELVALFPVLTFTGIGSMLFTGWLVDRIGANRLAGLYLLPFALGYALMGQVSGIGLAGLAMVFMGLSVGASATLASALWAEVYGTAHLGRIRAMIGALMVLGSAIGPGLTGWLIDRGVTMPEQCAGIAAYFLVAAVLGAIGGQGAARRLVTPHSPCSA